ncbi:PRC-barrel domain-containing protein [Oceanibacterium hippocampi]|uniref:PRC-barrel domain protein n=1 Tax=Oceanibacterium hippocampi TaxID=745714 RepID=A0A1Y5TF68_9PROT|nr:PRC-barrel domain-containing protein [Oceanibacterium hippocampi]SLN62535.1 hypothetical protein OCH7691_02772 [Oceanibacterium hippocampi]
MLQSMKELQGYRIQASDGDVGKANDFFFDDRVWTVRYMVVDTGWLFGRKVLVAPDAVNDVNIVDEKFVVGLSKKAIEEGPGVSTDLPVSRQEEINLRRHYNWPYYWEAYPAGVMAAPLVPPLQPVRAIPEERNAAGESEAEIAEGHDSHLRSANEVEGYHIEALDGEIGHVEDFLVDDETWVVRYMVIDTRNWLPGRKVIVAPVWAKAIDWSAKIVQVDLERQAIKESPEFTGHSEIGPEFEKSLESHYDRPLMWP